MNAVTLLFACALNNIRISFPTVFCSFILKIKFHFFVETKNACNLLYVVDSITGRHVVCRFIYWAGCLYMLSTQLPGRNFKITNQIVFSPSFSAFSSFPLFHWSFFYCVEYVKQTVSKCICNYINNSRKKYIVISFFPLPHFGLDTHSGKRKKNSLKKWTYWRFDVNQSKSKKNAVNLCYSAYLFTNKRPTREQKKTTPNPRSTISPKTNNDSVLIFLQTRECVFEKKSEKPLKRNLTKTKRNSV